MKTLYKLLLVLPLVYSTNIFAENCKVYGETQLKNIQVVNNSSNNNFNKRNIEDINKYISAERYIQHRQNGKDGTQYLAGFIKSAKEISVKNIRTLAENDMVLAQNVYRINGTPVVGYDWYRVHDGKITEHWDVIRHLAKGEDVSFYTAGPDVNTKSCLDKEKVRSIALDYFYTTWDNMDASVAEEYLAEDFVQHNPRAIKQGQSDKDTLVNLVHHLNKTGFNVQIEIAKIIVSGDFAAIHAKWTAKGKSRAVTDLLRFDENYKIVEHWDGLEEIAKDNSNPRDPVF